MLNITHITYIYFFSSNGILNNVLRVCLNIVIVYLALRGHHLRHRS